MNNEINFEEFIKKIDCTIYEKIDVDNWNISIEVVLDVVEFLQRSLEDMRTYIVNHPFSNKEEEIYFFKRSNFAANQLVNNMEIITFESKAYKELDNKITAIVDYIFNHMEAESTNEDEIWVDSYEVCTFLKISEVKRMLEERLIRSNKENIQDLITNHQLHVKERRNLRKNK